MEAIPFVIAGWIVQIVVATILLLPIMRLSRGRVHWRAYELVVFVVPFAIWFVLSAFTGLRWKSFSNVLIEPALFALAIPLAVAARAFFAPQISQRAWFAALLSGVTVAALTVYFIVPGLPE